MSAEWIELHDLQAVAKAQADGWEIDVLVSNQWACWDGDDWSRYIDYRARPKQPKMKKVKMRCWFDGAFLHWVAEGFENHAMKCRVPELDREIEIEE